MQRIIALLCTLLCLSCSCNKEQDSNGSVPPELNGTYAHIQDESLWVGNGSESIELSSTWKLYSIGSPSLSPDGRTLIFHARDAGKWDLYSYDIQSGKVPTAFTASIDADCKSPRYSADGKWIVFVKNGQIALMNTENGSVTNLTFDAAASNDSPAINSDGSKVVYVDRSTTPSKLVDLDVASLSSTTIKGLGSSATGKPVFTSTGTLIYTSGGNICSQGKSIFKNASDACPVEGDWILFTSQSVVNLGNIANGDSKVAFKRNCTELTYSPAQVSFAQPEDGGKTEAGDKIDSDTKLPKLGGKLVYHNYTSYDALDSRMYVYDFASDELTEISTGWTGIDNAMNGSFSPDGRYICFMGISKASGSWDIFLHETGSRSQPVNLTADGNWRDEDPKFSFDGTKICFKRNDALSEIDMSTRKIKVLTNNPDEAYSMPFYTVDGSSMVFGGGHDPNSYIGLWDIASSTAHILYDVPQTVEYYPITLDEKSFYYTQHLSSSDNHDQLYKGFFDGSPAKYLPFNIKTADNSDACPVGSGWLIFVSTRQGGDGAYDMYIANDSSGAVFSLSSYNKSLNTSKNELGPCYLPPR